MSPVSPVPEGGCGPRTQLVCRWVYERTGGDADLALLADWLVGRPLAIAGLLLVGWVARRVVRRTVGHGLGRRLSRPADLRRAGPGGDTEVPAREEARRVERATAVGAAVASTLGALTWVLTLLAIAGVLGVDLGPVLASAGLAGIAIAFGAQSLIKDMLAGLFILLEDHFAIGDEVDLGEAIGVVERMTLRETVLRDLDGTVWHVRNGEIERVGNHSQVWSAAMIDITVAHGSDLPAAHAVLADAAAAVARTPPFDHEVVGTPEVLGVEAIGPDGITLRLLVRTLAGRQFTLHRALLAQIVESTAARDVELATHQITVRVPGRSRVEFSPAANEDHPDPARPASASGQVPPGHPAGHPT